MALRLALLFMCLVAVVWAAGAIRKGGVVGLFASLGADVGDPNYIQICPKRVRSFVWADGKRIEEVDKGSEMTWQALDTPASPARGLNYLNLEKWLSAHCLTKGSAGPATKPGQLQNSRVIVKITYTNGQDVEIKTLETDPATFIWNNRLIQAHDLQAGFDALRVEAGWAEAKATPIPATSSGH